MNTKSVYLMFKGPQMKIIFNSPPDFSQAMGLKNKEYNNQ